MTPECRQDITCALVGFLAMCSRILPGCPIMPGFINSDVVENFFCQQRGISHGLNTNPTMSQYGPAINSIILGQRTVSRKSNAAESQAASFRDCSDKPSIFSKKRRL